MMPHDCPDRLPADTHWPATQYTLYDRHLAAGEQGRDYCTTHVMEVYRGSLMRFYQGCAGSAGFPRLPRREGQVSDEDHAVDVVHEYFAKRSRDLIPKWAEFCRTAPPEHPRHLRGFIKQDFRFHCQEMLRMDLRYHNRARPLDLEADPVAAEPLPMQQETTYLALAALVRVAIETVLAEYPTSEHQELRVLIEHRILHQRQYRDFADQLTGSLVRARQQVVRFKRKLVPVLRELIREQGDSVAELMEDLS
ncbi:MAG: hypothetical protein AB7O52_18655 [Planctomycetota bacterium]